MGMAMARGRVTGTYQNLNPGPRQELVVLGLETAELQVRVPVRVQVVRAPVQEVGLEVRVRAQVGLEAGLEVLKVREARAMGTSRPRRRE